jgi:hypothetical protein
VPGAVGMLLAAGTAVALRGVSLALDIRLPGWRAGDELQRRNGLSSRRTHFSADADDSDGAVPEWESGGAWCVMRCSRSCRCSGSATWASCTSRPTNAGR